MVNTSSNHENPSDKLIRLLEEQLDLSNQQNKELSEQVKVLTEQVRHLTKLLYGAKTEKSKYNAPDGQTSLFDDDSTFTDFEQTEEQSQQTISYTVVRKVQKKNEMVHYVLMSR